MRAHLKTRIAIVALAIFWAVAANFSAAAQEPERTATEELYDMFDIRVISLEHAQASQVLQLMAMFSKDGMLTADDDLNAILLTAPKPLSERLEAAIKLLDVPRRNQENDRNVELTVRLIEGSGSGTGNEVNADGIPASLKSVIVELGEIFTYAQYRLVDTLFLRCRDGSEASTSGMLPSGSSDSEESVYSLRIDRVSITDGEPLGIRLDEVSFEATMPQIVSQSGQGGQQQVRRQVSRRRVGIRADIDVREGQQVVIGKASLSAPDVALFVVISAKVVGG